MAKVNGSAIMQKTGLEVAALPNSDAFRYCLAGPPENRMTAGSTLVPGRRRADEDSLSLPGATGFVSIYAASVTTPWSRFSLVAERRLLGAPSNIYSSEKGIG
jgi:hypothetical protein